MRFAVYHATTSCEKTNQPGPRAIAAAKTSSGAKAPLQSRDNTTLATASSVGAVGAAALSDVASVESRADDHERRDLGHDARPSTRNVIVAIGSRSGARAGNR